MDASLQQYQASRATPNFSAQIEQISADVLEELEKHWTQVWRHAFQDLEPVAITMAMQEAPGLRALPLSVRSPFYTPAERLSAVGAAASFCAFSCASLGARAKAKTA